MLIGEREGTWMLSLTLIFLSLGVCTSAIAEAPTAARPLLRLSLKTDDWIRSLAFSPDGKTLAAGTFTNRIVLWDLSTGKELGQVTADEGNQGGYLPWLVFSADGKRLASIHDTGRLSRRARIYLWDVTDKRQLRKARTFRAEAIFRVSGVWRVAFSPDGKLLAAGEPKGTIVIWETDTGRERLRFQGGVAAAFSPDGRAMLSVGHDGMIHRWAPGTNQLIKPGKETAPTDFIHADAAIFAPSGRLVAISDGFTTLLKDVATGRTVHRVEFPHAVIPVVFSPDDRILATVAKEGLSLFEVNTGKEVGWRPGHGAAAFSSVGGYLAWSDGQSIILEKTPLAQAGTSKLTPAFTSPEVTLRAKLIANRNSYFLDLGGLTAAEFSKEILFNYPPTPLVDLTLELRNTGNKLLTIRGDGDGLDLEQPTFYLVGSGAMNLFELAQNSQVFTGVDRSGRLIALAPGATYTRRIATLGNSDRAYWLLPGEYVLYGQCHGAISPAPKGADDAGDGYGYISLWTPPVRLTVLPARNPSAQLLEKRRDTPSLGALVTADDRDTSKLPDRLARPVILTRLLADAPSLRGVLDYLSDRYDMDFRINEAAFKMAGRDGIGEVKPKGGPLEGVNLNTVLHSLLESVDATCEFRKETVWIVPTTRPQSLAERLRPADEHFFRQLYVLITLQPGIPRSTPLAKALQRFNFPILIDHRAFERAGIKDIDKTPVQLSEKVDVRLSAVLRELCQQAGATFVVRDHIVLIIPAER